MLNLSRIDEKIESPGLNQRLVVLVPGDLTDPAEFARATHLMAVQHKRDVLYLALNSEENNRLPNSRLLATLEALTSDEWITARSVQIKTGSWASALRNIYRPSDLVVCQTGQMVSSAPFKKVPLNLDLEEELKIKVHLLNGNYEIDTSPSRQWLRALAFWAGVLAILASFTFLECRVEVLMAGAMKTALLLILWVFELVLVLNWGRLTG